MMASDAASAAAGAGLGAGAGAAGATPRALQDEAEWCPHCGTGNTGPSCLLSGVDAATCLARASGAAGTPTLTVYFDDPMSSRHPTPTPSKHGLPLFVRQYCARVRARCSTRIMRHDGCPVAVQVQQGACKAWVDPRVAARMLLPVVTLAQLINEEWFRRAATLHGWFDAVEEEAAWPDEDAWLAGAENESQGAGEPLARMETAWREEVVGPLSAMAQGGLAATAEPPVTAHPAYTDNNLVGFLEAGTGGVRLPLTLTRKQQHLWLAPWPEMATETSFRVTPGQILVHMALQYFLTTLPPAAFEASASASAARHAAHRTRQLRAQQHAEGSQGAKQALQAAFGTSVAKTNATKRSLDTLFEERGTAKARVAKRARRRRRMRTRPGMGVKPLPPAPGGDAVDEA